MKRRTQDPSASTPEPELAAGPATKPTTKPATKPSTKPSTKGKTSRSTPASGGGETPRAARTSTPRQVRALLRRAEEGGADDFADDLADDFVDDPADGRDAKRGPSPAGDDFLGADEAADIIGRSSPPREPVARPNSSKRRRRKTSGAQFRNSLRLGLVLAGLTAINVYVFFFKDDTSVKKLVEPAVTGKALDDKAKAVAEARGGIEEPGRKPGATPGATTAFGRPGAEGSKEKALEGKIGPNDTLGTVLEREGLGSSSGAVVRALEKVFDPKLIRPGEGYTVVFDDEGEPESFEYIPSPAVRYVVTRDGEGTWGARKEEQPVEVRVELASGVITSSLYESIQGAGESSALVSLLVDLFAWDINFYIDTHPQDHWKVVVEKQYLGGQFYKYGHVLAAEYGGKVGTFRAFHWNASPAKGSSTGRYYDEKGQAIAKSMLKTPLRFVRISSKFDRKRFHPILHRTKAHLGIDYAAPTGTPVWASMGGKVVEAQMKRGSGNTVVINHGSGLATRYYHLSRFAKGLKAGQTVKQKEVIGYVGTTGLSTGPHLHFSVTKNGAFVDPSKMQVLREAPVANRAAYLAAIKARVAQLKTLPPLVAKN
jgi:murein DD-endopeptidase MepM/ murein hydrolase activator NlpD